jgi:hypothetical protein
VRALAGLNPIGFPYASSVSRPDLQLAGSYTHRQDGRIGRHAGRHRHAKRLGRRAVGRLLAVGRSGRRRFRRNKGIASLYQKTGCASRG